MKKKERESKSRGAGGAKVPTQVCEDKSPSRNWCSIFFYRVDASIKTMNSLPGKLKLLKINLFV